MAMGLQNESIRRLRERETEIERMRYEWRKSCDQSHEKQMDETKKKVNEEKRGYFSGPTTIDAIGTNYAKQLQKLKVAEKTIDQRGNRVAQVIQAPTAKFVTADSRTKEDHGLIDDRRH